jgi:hypothetical protein
VIAFFVLSIICFVSNRRRTVPWAVNLPQHEHGYSLPYSAWLSVCVYSLSLSYSMSYVTWCTVHLTSVLFLYLLSSLCYCLCLRTLVDSQLDCCEIHEIDCRH